MKKLSCSHQNIIQHILDVAVLDHSEINIDLISFPKLKLCHMDLAYYLGLYSLVFWNDTLETRAAIFNKCVLDQSQIMGRNVEQSLDSLCLCPTWLIRVELCTSRTITPQCHGGPSLNKQGWYESHVSWLQEMRDADPKHCPSSTIYMWAPA